MYFFSTRKRQKCQSLCEARLRETFIYSVLRVRCRMSTREFVCRGRRRGTRGHPPRHHDPQAQRVRVSRICWSDRAISHLITDDFYRTTHYTVSLFTRVTHESSLSTRSQRLTHSHTPLKRRHTQHRDTLLLRRQIATPLNRDTLGSL